MTHITAWAVLAFLVFFIPLQILATIGTVLQIYREAGIALGRVLRGRPPRGKK